MTGWCRPARAIAAAYGQPSGAPLARLIAGLAILLRAGGRVAARVAEIDPARCGCKIGGLTSYLDRIGTLDSGARVWTDPVGMVLGSLQKLVASSSARRC